MRRPREQRASSSYPEEEAVETLESAPEPNARWFQRVLPVTALAVALIGVAALLFPTFRDQVELSMSRQSQPYVELYFHRRAGKAAQVVCTTKGSTARVRFVVASHLDKRQAVAYRVSLVPTAKGAKAQRKAGSVRVTPSTAVEVRTSFVRPRQGYTVSVRLPALDQQLRAHCPGRPS
jgi:hypothetical protein